MINRTHLFHSISFLLVFIISFILAGCSRVQSRAAEVELTIPDWENPEVTGINKEPGHCTLVPYLDMRRALEADRSSSPFYKSLNGKWKFHWVRKPADRPVDFYRPEYDVSNWKEIDTVEGRWMPYVRDWMTEYTRLSLADKEMLTCILMAADTMQIKDGYSKSTGRVKKLLEFHLEENSIVASAKKQEGAKKAGPG